MVDLADLIGRPFEDGGRGPATFDCWGLTREVLRRFGVDAPDYLVSAFSFDDIAGTIARESCSTWERHEVPNIPVPSVLVLRCGPVAVWNHTGVYLGGGKFIHARERIGVCIDRIDHPAWQRRIEGFYTPRGG